MSDKPKDPFEGKNPTDPNGLKPKAPPPPAGAEKPVTVTFAKPHLSYNIGEQAAFAPDVAKQLVEDKVANGGGGNPAHPAPHKAA
jgi:hypothetical protein